MIQLNKRKFNLLVFLAACIFISVAATKPSAISNTSANKNLLNDTGIFKNLKVLPKNISEDSLDHLMHTFTAALGVRCNFCHAPGNDGKLNFPSDEKEEKDIARYMIIMAADINKTYFNSEHSAMPDTINIVRCMTCHHGSPYPGEAAMSVGNNGMMPPPGQNENMPPPPHQH